MIHGVGIRHRINEPGMAGIEQLKDLLVTFFGHRIKRYILGQVLSSEAEATGLGSGVAELHLDTFLQIIRYDARNLEETITDELIEPLKLWNFPAAKGVRLRFKIDTESPNIEEKLSAFKSAWEMGARLKERDVMDMVGAESPGPEDRALQNPQAQQAAAMQQPGGMYTGPGPQGQPASPPQSPEQVKAGMADDVMRSVFGSEEAQDPDGQKIAYVSEGGKWEEREIPDPEHDTGDRMRAGDYAKRKQAPKGGVSIDGKKYAGGQFVPDEGESSGSAGRHDEESPSAEPGHEDEWSEAATALTSLREVRGSDQVKEAAKAFVNKPLINSDSGITATASRESIGKMLSRSDRDRSVSLMAHLNAVANLDVLFPRAIHRTSRPDERHPESIKEIHHFDVPMPHEGDVLRVKMMAKEYARTQQGTRLYTLSVVEIETPASERGEPSSAEPIPESVPPAGVSDRFARLAEAVKRKMPPRGDSAAHAEPYRKRSRDRYARVRQQMVESIMSRLNQGAAS